MDDKPDVMCYFVLASILWCINEQNHLKYKYIVAARDDDIHHLSQYDATKIFSDI